MFDMCCAPRVPDYEGQGINAKGVPSGSGSMDNRATVGIGWFHQSGAFTVAQVVPGGPAALTGKVNTGDILESVDGMRPTDTNHLRCLVTGAPGSEVELVLRSAYSGPEKRIRLVRKIMNASSNWNDNPVTNIATSSSSSSSSSLSRPGSNRASASILSQQPTAGMLMAPTINNNNNNNNNRTSYNGIQPLQPSRASLDNVMPPVSFQAPPPPPPQQQQSIYGVGINFSRNEQGLFCVETLCCGYPASNLLQPRDVLVAVDGVNVEHASPEQVLKMVRGARGTQCHLSFRPIRGGEIISLTLGRFYAIV